MDAHLTFDLTTLAEVKGYSDSHYGGNTENLMSTLGHIFTYGSGAILEVEASKVHGPCEGESPRMSIEENSLWVKT